MADTTHDRDLKNALAAIEKQFGKGAIMQMGEHAVSDVQGISTGALSLDIALGGKGLPRGRLLLKYPLRLSLNPFIADIGTLLPEMVSGAVIVSVVMSLPTTGPMLLDALRSQDMFLAGSLLMFLALLTVIGVFISDLALATLDPRIRLQSGRPA